MIKVELQGMALKATSFEIDDLLGKVGEVVERIPDGNWIIKFGHNRTYALPEYYLGETVLKIVYDDTHGTPPEPEVVKKSNTKKKAVAKRKETMKLRVGAESIVGGRPMRSGTPNPIVKKRTDGSFNLK